MPEEINRIVTDRLADLLWTPSPDGDDNLIAEGVPPERIEFVGNIMIDAFELQRPQIEALQMTRRFDVEPGHYGIVTLRSEEHTSELQSLMRISYAVFCLKKKQTTQRRPNDKRSGRNLC